MDILCALHAWSATAVADTKFRLIDYRYCTSY
eukprot:SAG31_NODE_15195_length_766_cov_0.986507_2_plen_31_part_01